MLDEQDAYHLPKRLKKAGKLLLQAASQGEYAHVESTVGKKIIYDFDRRFWFHLTNISNHLDNIHVAFATLFSSINGKSSTDLIRSIGRLDGAIASLVNACQEVDSYELEEGEHKDLEESGLSLLHETLASLIQYAVEVEKDLGQQLVDAERMVNEYPESLSAGKHTININFDSTKSIDKIKPLLEWYTSYKEVIAEPVNDPEEYIENTLREGAQASLDRKRQARRALDINRAVTGIVRLCFGSRRR